MRRKKAREITMQLIFEMNIQNDYSNEIISRLLLKIPENNDQFSYIKNAIQKFVENMDRVDSIIGSNLTDWRLDRIAKVDLAILRLAVTEIIFFDDIPVGASINEAVEMTKKFSTEESGAFVNGVLGSIVEKM